MYENIKLKYVLISNFIIKCKFFMFKFFTYIIFKFNRPLPKFRKNLRRVINWVFINLRNQIATTVFPKPWFNWPCYSNNTDATSSVKYPVGQSSPFPSQDSVHQRPVLSLCYCSCWRMTVKTRRSLQSLIVKAIGHSGNIEILRQKYL